MNIYVCSPKNKAKRTRFFTPSFKGQNVLNFFILSRSMGVPVFLRCFLPLGFFVVSLGTLHLSLVVLSETRSGEEEA